MEKELRDKLELEEEMESFIENKERLYLKQIEAKDKELTEKDKMIKELQQKLADRNK
jgi:hypothetical protein